MNRGGSERLVRVTHRWLGMGAVGFLLLSVESSGGRPIFGGTGVEGKEYSDEVASKIDAAVKKIIDGAYHAAHEIIVTHRVVLNAIAAELIEKETIERDDFETLLITHGITPKKKEDIEHSPVV
jgi:cell division protease FtsH